MRSILSVSVLFLLGLTLIGCDGSGECGACDNDIVSTANEPDTDSGGCDPSCSDDTSSHVADGYLNVRAMINGSLEPTNIIINGKVVGSSGTDIALAPGTYTFYVGDDPEVTSGDGIPLDTAGSQNATVWEGSTWIHPPVTVTIASGETVFMNDVMNATPETSDDALELNFYTSGMWTCDNGHEVSGRDVEYSNGSLMFLQTIGQQVVTGADLQDVSFPEYIYGAFESPTTAALVNVDGGLTNYYCWSGDEEADPRTETE